MLVCSRELKVTTTRRGQATLPDRFFFEIRNLQKISNKQDKSGRAACPRSDTMLTPFPLERSQSMDEFDRYRAAMNEKLLGSDHLGIKRFFALDTQAYEDGALDKTHEGTDGPGRLNRASLRRLHHVSHQAMCADRRESRRVSRCFQRRAGGRRIDYYSTFATSNRSRGPATGTGPEEPIRVNP